MATTWYLWAMNDNPRTNEYLVKVIGEQNQEYLYADKLCADGRRRNLFRCPKGYANVQSTISALKDFNLKFEVFKEDIEDVIVCYLLWKKSVQKAAKAMRLNKALGNHHGCNTRFKSG
jgi:hypothetical protein